MSHHDLRAVQYTDPRAFVEAAATYDDYFMNFGLGFVMDSLHPAHPVNIGGEEDKETAPVLGKRVMFAVFSGDSLL